jgi:ABC-type multidrug transport system ATPase subunit
MTDPLLAARSLTARYGARLVFEDVSFTVAEGQSLGVLGRDGAGKTTLLRMLVGLRRPAVGEVRIGGRVAREGLRFTPTAYFAGDATLPGSARATAWGRLGTGGILLPDRRPVRALSRGVRQLLGLRAVLGRQPLRLVVLDEPWEGLGDDARDWLDATLELKRDRGAAVVLSSQRLSDLTELCDVYVILERGRARWLRAVDLAANGVPSVETLAAAIDAGSASHAT